jgi:hypothetical protein
MKLPPAPYDACDKVTTRVSSLSLVRERESGTETLQKAVDLSDNHDPLKAGYFRW